MASSTKTRNIVTWVVVGFVSLAMAASAIGKLLQVQPVTEMFGKANLVSWVIPIGILELVCAILFLLPRTAGLGTLLVTGYFGAAFLFHLVIADGGFVGSIFLGLMAWLGGYLRNPHQFGKLLLSDE